MSLFQNVPWFWNVWKGQAGCLHPSKRSRNHPTAAQHEPETWGWEGPSCDQLTTAVQLECQMMCNDCNVTLECVSRESIFLIAHSPSPPLPPAKFSVKTNKWWVHSYIADTQAKALHCLGEGIDAESPGSRPAIPPAIGAAASAARMLYRLLALGAAAPLVLIFTLIAIIAPPEKVWKLSSSWQSNKNYQIYQIESRSSRRLQAWPSTWAQSTRSWNPANGNAIAFHSGITAIASAQNTESFFCARSSALVCSLCWQSRFSTFFTKPNPDTRLYHFLKSHSTESCPASCHCSLQAKKVVIGRGQGLLSDFFYISVLCSPLRRILSDESRWVLEMFLSVHSKSLTAVSLETLWFWTPLQNRVQIVFYVGAPVTPRLCREISRKWAFFLPQIVSLPSFIKPIN